MLTQAEIRTIAQEVATILRQGSRSVDNIPLVDTLEGMQSLPALRYNGGVPEVVKVSLPALQNVATDAVREATTAANSAASAANTAAGTATAAAGNANDAAGAARTAAGSVDAAKIAALQAASDAIAAKTAADTAASNANTKAGAADTAAAAALQAASDALAAKTAADTAAAGARTAKTDADLAATNATRQAGAAATAAQGADAAAADVAEAKREALEAAARATAVTADAEAELVLMRQLEQSISGASSMAPNQMLLFYPSKLTLRNPCEQKIEARLLPSYTLQNVLFLGDDAAVTVTPDGTVTPVKVGISKIHVIPTQATHLYQTITIEVKAPSIRLTSSGKMRLDSRGRIRLT